MINNNSTDFSRYTYFYVNYLLKQKKIKKANDVLNLKLQQVPRNLVLNQLNENLNFKKQNILENSFSCQNVSHIVAELFYITANALSSQSLFSLSNFYLNLAKYLNQEFISYNTLLAENYFMIGNYNQSKKIYSLLKKIGEVYSWHSSRQIALIDLENDRIEQAISRMEKSYNNLKIQTCIKLTIMQVF